AYIGVCGNPVETVKLTCVSNTDFAIGEFGIKCEDVPGACCETLIGECEDDVIWQDCVGAGLRFVGDTLCAALDPPCTPCVDVELIAPGVWSGTTVDAGDHCALRAGQTSP
ncbi:MAG: hypothetical protein GX547_15450, partial [Phycisphaerae bacterium]|nr:hypothetical protein [Phycisphaerae bacterium]